MCFFRAWSGAITLNRLDLAAKLALPVGPLAALGEGENPESPAARREALEDWGRKGR